MGQSIFKNFDPEDLTDIFYMNETKDQIRTLVLQMNIEFAIHLCSFGRDYLSTDDKRFGALIFKNHEFVALEKNIKLLAKIGLESPTVPEYLTNGEGGGPDSNAAVFELAIHGSTLKNIIPVMAIQIHSFHALRLTDDALSTSTVSGLTPNVCDRLLLASYYLSKANVEFSLIADPNAMERLNKKMSLKQSLNALNGHLDSKMGKTKHLILECWKVIQAGNPKRFNASEFARKMQIKHPLITDITTIKRWCTEWKRQKVSSSPAD